MQIPSPIEEFQFNNLNFKVKRDDLIDPFISGNKWRKLNYQLAEATRLEKNHLVTFGGAFSNHLLATAAAGAKFKFKTTAIVRGEKVDNEILFFCAIFGMNLIFVDRTAYRDKENLFEKLFSKDPNAYFIDEGGAGALGQQGCENIIHEINLPISNVFCAAGTGTTAIGILKTLQSKYPESILHIIPVLKNLNLETQILNSIPDAKNFIVHEDYHFGGYAKTTPQLLNFIKKFTSTTGLIIDPIYTGKMFFAMFNLIEEQKVKYDENFIAIHTGGALGSLGMRNKFDF